MVYFIAYLQYFMKFMQRNGHFGIRNEHNEQIIRHFDMNNFMARELKDIRCRRLKKKDTTQTKKIRIKKKIEKKVNN